MNPIIFSIEEYQTGILISSLIALPSLIITFCATAYFWLENIYKKEYTFVSLRYVIIEEESSIEEESFDWKKEGF